MYTPQEKRIGNIFFFTLLFAALYIGYLMFSPFLEILMFSVIITIVAYPVYEKIKGRIGKEGLSALLSTFFVFLFVLIPSTVLVIIIVQQIIDIVPVITKFFSEEQDYHSILENIPFVGSLYKKAIVYLETANININIGQFARQHYSTALSFMVDQSRNILTNVGLLVAGMLFVLMTIFFLFRDGKIYYKELYDLIPLTDREKNFLFDQSYNAIKAIFMGTLLTGITQGFLGFAAYLIAGIPFSIFWGFATFIASLIPLGGAALIWAPVALYAFFAKGILTGILLLLWGIFGISLVDNFLRPILIGGKTNINTLILVFAILGGLQVFGFIGIFVAPVIIVLISNLLMIYKERFTNTILIDAFDEVPEIIERPQGNQEPEA